MEEDTMTGRIFNIQRFSVHDGPGIRTTVFFKGCNLHCIWCHNPESIPRGDVLEFNAQKCIGCGQCFLTCPQGAHRMTEAGKHVIDRDKCIRCMRCAQTCYAGALVKVGRDVEADYVEKQILSDKPYYERSGGGVTFSGGECMIQTPFLLELLQRCKKQGIHTAVDTAGNVEREAFEDVLPYTDLFLFDVKAADPQIHKALTGVSNERILQNLRFLSGSGARIFIRVPLIPSKNLGEMPAIAALLADIRPEKIEILPYHKLGLSKYEALDLPNACKDEEVPTDEIMQKALRPFLDAGLPAFKS